MGGHEVESHLEQRAPDGTITTLTDGPADTSPALSPDGTHDRVRRGRSSTHGTLDTELWLLRARQRRAATPLVDAAADRRERARCGRATVASCSRPRCCAARRRQRGVLVGDLRRPDETPRRRAHARGSRGRDRAAHSRDRTRVTLDARRSHGRSRVPSRARTDHGRRDRQRAAASGTVMRAPRRRRSFAAGCSSPRRRRIRQRRGARTAVARRRRADGHDPRGPVRRGLDARGARAPRTTTTRASAGHGHRARAQLVRRRGGPPRRRRCRRSGSI